MERDSDRLSAPGGSRPLVNSENFSRHILPLLQCAVCAVCAVQHPQTFPHHSKSRPYSPDETNYLRRRVKIGERVLLAVQREARRGREAAGLAPQIPPLSSAASIWSRPAVRGLGPCGAVWGRAGPRGPGGDRAMEAGRVSPPLRPDARRESGLGQGSRISDRGPTPINTARSASAQPLSTSTSSEKVLHPAKMHQI